MSNHILATLDRLSLGAVDTQISPISQSAMLFTKIKQLYFEQLRNIKKQEDQTKTSVFSLTLNRNIRAPCDNYHSLSIIPSSIQNESIISVQSIESLIKVSNLVDSHTQSEIMMQMEDCLIRKIKSLRDSQDILKMFLKVSYMPRYLSKGQARYLMIEDRIIKELLNVPFSHLNPDILLKFIVSLPFRSRSLLPLLSHFIQQTTSQPHIKSLYDIFSGLFPQQPTKQQISCLLKISTKQATQKIHNMVKQQKISSFQMLQIEARQKLKRVPSIFNSKGEAIMMFVYFVAIYGGDIWEQIIQWQKTAIQQYKDWFKNNAKSIVSDNHAKDHLEVILLKLTNINYQSQISQLFFNHVIDTKSKQTFNSLIIKRFLTSKICYKMQKLKDNNEKIVYSPLAFIFSLDLTFIDILLEVFENQSKCKSFYSYLLESGQQNQKLLISYLDECYNSKRFKFMEFFLNFLSVSRSEILQVNNNVLLHYFLQTIDFQLAYILIKQMSLGNPSKYYVVFMKSWFSQKFHGEEELRTLKSTIIRNMNILLLRSDVQLNKHFITHFQQTFYPDLNQEQRSRIMTDVPKNRKQSLGI